jgi:hypothetical protein
MNSPVSASAATGQPRTSVRKSRMPRSSRFTAAIASSRPFWEIKPESTGCGAYWVRTYSSEPTPPSRSK